MTKSILDDEELRKIVKERLKEKRESSKRAKQLVEDLRQTRNKVWHLENEISEAKGLVGERKGIQCPARKKEKSSYANYCFYTCLAKRFVRNTFYNADALYRKHCFYCKLTPEQAKTAIMYDRIFNGKRKEK